MSISPPFCHVESTVLNFAKFVLNSPNTVLPTKEILILFAAKKCWWNWLKGLISPTFYSKLLCSQIPKEQKIQSNCQSFCAFGICTHKSCTYTCWWNWHQGGKTFTKYKIATYPYLHLCCTKINLNWGSVRDLCKFNTESYSCIYHTVETKMVYEKQSKQKVINMMEENMWQCQYRFPSLFCSWNIPIRGYQIHLFSVFLMQKDLLYFFLWYLQFLPIFKHEKIENNINRD